MSDVSKRWTDWLTVDTAGDDRFVRRPRSSVLFCSSAVLDPRVGHTMDVLLHLSLSSVILTDSSTESPVHVLMLSIQAVRGLPVSSVEMTVSALLLM